MTDTVVVEGQVKLRDGKKWRNRWVVLRKPSPVADCLSLLVYKDKAERHKGHRERSCLTLGDICGLEPGLSYEGVGYTLAIVSLTQSVLLGFDRRENLLAWDLRIRYSLGEAHRFNVHVLPGTKLDCGPATLHLCNNLLVITRDLPPVVAGQWKLSDLRRYGAVPNGFVFEGGTRCGSWAGVFFLACAEGEQISFLFDCIVRGISPSRGPFGLRPVLPDAGSSSSSSRQGSSEERIQQEAIELEKRLSRLSTCSRQSSTTSTCSYSTSTAGDDCSISSSSSEASHSDTSLGSRLTLWAEPSKCPTPSGLSSSGVASRMSTPIPRRTLTPSLSADDHLYAAVMSGTVGPGTPLRPSSSTSSFRLERARGLQDAGRQSSTDSGIATTGSHSSYSGSFSSYTGSLDMATGEAEDFGSLLSLPSTPSLAPTITSLSHTALEPISSPCSCPVPTPITHAPTPVPPLSGSEYQVPPSPGEQEQPHQQPLQLRDLPCYDTPRRLLPQGTPITDSGALYRTLSASQDRIPGPQETLSESSVSSPPAPEASSKSKLSLVGSLRTLLSPPPTPPPTIPNTCPVCRTAKCNHLFDTSYITPEQWLSARKKCFTQTTPSSQHSSLPSSSSHVERIPGQMPALSPSAAEYLANLQLAQGTPELEDRGRYELMGSYAQLQRSSRDSEASFLVKPPFFICPPRLHLQASVSAESKGNYERMALTSEVQPKTDPPSGEGGVALPAPMDSRMSPFDRFLGDNVNYVNIPISPAARRQLHYMELDLQDTAAAVRGGGSTKYAQIDIAATEAAQRVGAQHAQGREERLQELEQRKRGANN